MVLIIAQKNNGTDPHQHGLFLLDAVVKRIYSDIHSYNILKNKNGKPSIAELPDFHFNISHSGDWTVIAVSKAEIGVDIQYIKQIRRDLPRRFYTERENRYLDFVPLSDMNDSAIKMWSFKESIAKAKGESLATLISKINTIEYDSTWITSLDGLYIQSIPFPDEKYVLVCACFEKLENNYKLLILD